MPCQACRTKGRQRQRAMLKQLKGIGPEFAGVLWSEALFRSFANRRQVAAYAGLGADTLAERIRRSRTGRLQSREPAAANNHDPTRLVVAEAPAPFATDPVVPPTRPAQWWPHPEGADRRPGTKAADRLLEICDRRSCTGRSRDNGRLRTEPILSNLPESDQLRRIQVSGPKFGLA